MKIFKRKKMKRILGGSVVRNLFLIIMSIFFMSTASAGLDERLSVRYSVLFYGNLSST